MWFLLGWTRANVVIAGVDLGECGSCWGGLGRTWFLLGWTRANVVIAGVDLGEFGSRWGGLG